MRVENAQNIRKNKAMKANFNKNTRFFQLGKIVVKSYQAKQKNYNPGCSPPPPPPPQIKVRQLILKSVESANPQKEYSRGYQSVCSATDAHHQ